MLSHHTASSSQHCPTAAAHLVGAVLPPPLRLVYAVPPGPPLLLHLLTKFLYSPAALYYFLYPLLLVCGHLLLACQVVLFLGYFLFGCSSC